MAFDIIFAPQVPDWLLVGAGMAAVAVTALALAARARGAMLRFAVFVLALGALANPLIVRETRESLNDVAALVIDRTQSQDVGTRRAEAEAAYAELKARLGALPGLELREAEVTNRGGTGEEGTALFAALDTALADVPPERIAGAIVITDGQVHDAPDAGKAAGRPPLHILLDGRPDEGDRKLTIVRSARFGIVGGRIELVVKVEDFGAEPGGYAHVDIRIDGVDDGRRLIPVGTERTITVDVAHGGENVIEIEAEPGPAELTLENNRAVIVVNGVRDSLRVLLVSGEPHAGERVWRNLLKADPAVDLVHFTILRPPEKQDGTPIDQLSLIAFPTRELFDQKLDEFDLIIFDRYKRRGILPLAYFENIARYVENGGALLLSSGPEFARPNSIYRTPLAAVLPAQPTGEVLEAGFRPAVTAAGRAHPVTRELTQSGPAGGEASWGRWFRMLGTEKLSGETVMEGPGARPLLVLDRVGKGRVAQLLSDQAWLWARGFEGGGPQAELLRRLAHWLMKEPDLEEERLAAAIADGQMKITRRTMAETAAPVTITFPSGRSETVTLAPGEPGLWTGSAAADELGLYRLTDGTLSAVAAAGPLNPREVADVRATEEILAPVARASGGSIAWLAEDGIPALRRVAPGRIAAGEGWIGLRANEAYRVTAVAHEALLPPWLALLLLAGALLVAWREEGR